MVTLPVRWMVLSALVAPAASALSQGPGPSQRFTVGGRDIVRVDFASTPIGDFPSSLEMVDGIIDVVAMSGRNMLRASSRSVIRVPLPQVLPQDFTLEFEIIPKAGGNPEDLAIEGTPLINQGVNSANVMWHRDYLQIVGGGATYDSKVPPTFAATLPSVLTQVVLSLQGETMKLWTNGRLMYTQSNRTFVRGRVLRVFLGGQDDGPNAVYLASLRVVDGAAVAPVVAGGAPGGNNPTGASAGAPGPAQLPTSSNPVPTPTPSPPSAPPSSTPPSQVPPKPPTSSQPSATPPSITMIVAPALPWGARINWTDVPGAAFWELERGEGQQTPSVMFSVEASSRHWIAGVTEDSDQLVLAGRQYMYRIKALAADRSVIASAQQNFATPASYPVIPGLTATLGPLATLNVGPNATAQSARLVTWTWDRNALGGGVLYATTDLFSTDAAGQATGLGTRWPESSQAYGMNATLAVATGMTVRFCASVARGSLGDLLSATCLDTPVTGGLNAVTTLGPTSPATTTLTAPVTPGFTVSVTMGPNGPVVSWSNAAGATAYRASRQKVDDANCCNTAYGARTFTATSPWQDQPLPVTGTYLYQVVANTPNGQVLAETQFAYTRPPTTMGPPPPRGGVSGPGAPASPRFVIVNPTPTTAQFSFDVVASAVGYRIRRSVPGTGRWTDLTPTPLPQMEGGFTSYSPYLVDGPLDHRQTYTYELHALQADGTYGTTPLSHTPPAPADPTAFTATVTGPGQVRLDWKRVTGARTYRISGPGTNGGLSALGTASSTAAGTLSHTLSNLPVGTHAWTIASNYEPGGVLTPSNAWPSATATVPAPDPAPRYRLVALGIRVNQQSREVNDAGDGAGDEVYLTALVNQTTLTRLPLPVVKEANLTVVVTRSLGSEAVSVPYGRIKAGTASAMGGLKTGDAVPATLDAAGATPATLHNNQFPLRLWEGSLEGDAVVVVHPALWEDDVDPRVQGNWLMLLSNEARGSYSPQADERTNSAYVTDERTYETYQEILKLSGGGSLWPYVFYNNARFNHSGLGSRLFQCTTMLGVLVRRPCEAHGVDRPIGLWGGGQPGTWSDMPIVLTKASVEKLLNVRAISSEPEPLGPGTFIVWLYDDVGGPAITEAIAQYKLYLRLERVP